MLRYKSIFQISTLVQDIYQFLTYLLTYPRIHIVKIFITMQNVTSMKDDSFDLGLMAIINKPLQKGMANLIQRYGNIMHMARCL
jgi:hypothetical protein